MKDRQDDVVLRHCFLLDGLFKEVEFRKEESSEEWKRSQNEEVVPMHPLVRDLYKRVIHVGREYPAGLDYVRVVWKKSLKNQNNCPSCFADPTSDECEREIRKAVAVGRRMVGEMVGVTQLKKYRAMKQRYDGSDVSFGEHSSQKDLEANAKKWH